MISFFKKENLISSLVLASCLAISSAKALQVGNMYFIGDSLSDQGNCPNPAIGNGKVPLTNGNTYAFYLGQKFGKNIFASSQGGTDYACIGASTGVPLVPGSPFTPYIKATGTQQIQELLNTNPKFGSHDLVTYWLGANDIILSPPINPPVVYPTFNAVTSVNFVQQGLNMLHRAGAPYIIVMNLPPLEKTPDGMNPANTPAQNAAYFNEPRAFNQELLTRLNNIGYKIIQIDIFSITNAILANPATFGFTNITTPCSTTPGQDCSTSFWYNGVHPTDKAHQMLAEGIYSILTAPDFYATLAQVPFSILQSNNVSIRQQLYPQQGAREIGKLYPFFGGNIGTTGTDIGTDRTGYNGPSGMATAGILSQINETFLLGAAIGQGTNKTSYAQENSTFSVNSTIFSLFASYQEERFYVNGVLNYSALRYDDIERQFIVGPVLFSADGDTQGSQEGVSMVTGYNVINRPNVQVGPIVNIEYQIINVDGYTENGADILDVAFDDQRNTSFVGGAGVQATFHAELYCVPVTTNLDLTLNKQLTGGERQIYFHQATLDANFASLPVLEPTYVFAMAGINFAVQLQHGIIASLGDFATLGENNTRANLVAAAVTAPI